MLRLYLKKIQLSNKLRRGLSSTEPSKKSVGQFFQEFSPGFKETTQTVFNIVGIISGLGLASATFSYVFEKIDAQKAHSLVLEGKLLALQENLKAQQEKLITQEKATEDKLKAQREKLISQEKATEDKLRAQLLLVEEKLKFQESLTRAQEKLYEEKLKSLTGNS